MKIQLILAVIALTFSFSATADGTGHSHTPVDHSKMDHSKMNPTQMESMGKAMEAEMIKIINTVDINERKKLFVAHKQSMQSMKKAMMENCATK
jgi:hypothetical protein